MAFATEVPAGDRLGGRHRVDYEWGDDEWLERRATQDPHARPMSVYEVHLGSWRQGLSYRELADQLVDYVVATSASPTSSCCRSPSTPSAARGATRSSSYFAPTSRFGSPGRLPLPRRHAAPGRHRRHRRLGPGALPQGRVGAGPLRRHRRSTSTPTRAGASSSTGAPTSSTSAAPRSATSSSPTPCTGSRSSTSTACGSTRWPRCSTSTTRARTASGCPTSYGGRENLEAVVVPAGDQRHGLQAGARAS